MTLLKAKWYKTQITLQSLFHESNIRRSAFFTDIILHLDEGFSFIS